MNPVDKVKVGRTDLFVTRMGMGCAALGSLYHEVTDDSARQSVEVAWSRGINYFDTAPLYGHGRSEERLGRVLRTLPRDSFVISTKVGRVLCPADSNRVESAYFEKPAAFEPVFDFSYEGVMRSFEESLRRLGLDRVDILLIHDPDDHYQDALLGAYPTLHELRSQGAVKAIGVGMNQTHLLAQFAREGDFDCFVLAGRYTLIDHSGLKEILPLCEQKGISVIIGGPYNSGILASGAVSGAKFNYQDAPAEIVERVRKLEEVCRRHSVPLKAAAVQFPLAHPAVASVIPGPRSAVEVEENLAQMAVPIPGDFWRDLQTDNLLPDEAPVPE